jgi:hypothetical protein
MQSSLTDKKKKRPRGRPEVDSEQVLVRLPRKQLNALEAWAKAQPDGPGRPEAIRRIIAEYLSRRGFYE